MKFYDSLTRQLQDLTPLDDKTVGVYSCGPTVYDHAHIGNLAAFIFADTLRRSLTAQGYQVHHVMNYTDVDDKTIKKAQAEPDNGDTLQRLRTVTDRYIAAFNSDMTAIGNDTAAMEFIRATDQAAMAAMQDMIRQLQVDGFAYLTDDGVYFSIEAYQASGKVYGQLSHIAATGLQQSRIQSDEYDRASAQDFALWKAAKPDEPSWDFTIAGQSMPGRPGWHIECSAMSRLLLGQPFDIHTGGIDLQFPHHENEIAQSTAGRDDPRLAQLFLHNEHILVDGKKMAKSAGNFYRLSELTDKGYEPLAFRLLVLQAHYRSQLHLSWEALDGAASRLSRWRAAAALQYQPTAASGVAEADLTAAADEIHQALTRDLATPEALARLDEVLQAVAQHGIATETIPAYRAFLVTADQLFGLGLAAVTDLTEAQKQLLRDREATRLQKNWAASDALRDRLAAEGIGLRDEAHGAVWYREG